MNIPTLIFIRNKDYIQSLRQIESLLPSISVEVPIEALTLLDSGMHPQTLVSQTLKRTLEHHQQLMCKIKAITYFRKLLIEQLSSHFSL